MIDPSGTTHAISTILEAALIGGLTNFSTRCILYKELENYNCTLKSTAGIYAVNLTVEWKDICKMREPGLVLNYTADAKLPEVTGSTDSGIRLSAFGNNVTHTYDTTTKIGSIYNSESVNTVGSDAFRGSSVKTIYNIDSSIIYIGLYALSRCNSLTSIELPNSLTVLYPQVFFYNLGITSITIPETVNSILQSAFGYCRNLLQVTLGKNLSFIGSGCFDGCSALQTLNFTGTQSLWNAISKGSNWNRDIATSVVHCSDGDVSI